MSVLFAIRVSVFILIAFPIEAETTQDDIKEGGCPNTWNISKSGSCYARATNYSGVESIIAASNLCRRKNGALASLLTLDDVYLAKRLLSELDFTDNYGYVGLNDIRVEGKFRWLDNSPLQANARWDTGHNEPDNNRYYGENDGSGQDCVILSYEGELNDAACCTSWYKKIFSALCEYDPYGEINDDVFRTKCRIQKSSGYSYNAPSAPESNNLDFGNTTTQNITATSTDQNTTVTRKDIEASASTLGETITTENVVTLSTGGKTTNATNALIPTAITSTPVHTTEGKHSRVKEPVGFPTTETPVKTSLFPTEFTSAQTNEDGVNISTTDTSIGPCVQSRKLILGTRCCHRRCYKKSMKSDFENFRILRNETNAYRRLFISPGDNRLSCVIIGTCALIFILGLCLAILVSDYQRLREAFLYNSHMERHRRVKRE